MSNVTPHWNHKTCLNLYYSLACFETMKPCCLISYVYTTLGASARCFPLACCSIEAAVKRAAKSARGCSMVVPSWLKPPAIYLMNIHKVAECHPSNHILPRAAWIPAEKQLHCWGSNKKGRCFFRFFWEVAFLLHFWLGMFVCVGHPGKTQFFHKKMWLGTTSWSRKIVFCRACSHMKLSQPNASEITAKHLVMSISKNQTACLLFPSLLLCRSPHPICLKRNSLTCVTSFWGGQMMNLGCIATC